MRILVAAVLLLTIGMSSAQSISRDCTITAGCLFVTDAFPLSGPQPQQCKLLDGATVIATQPTVAATTDNPGAPAGSLECRFPGIVLSSGHHALTAISVASGYADSSASAALSIDSLPGPLPTPQNLRAK